MQMSAEMNAVTTGALGVNEAALQHKVPAMTLKDRISGRVTHALTLALSATWALRRKMNCLIF